MEKRMHPRPRETKLLARRHQILNMIFREKQGSRFALARSLNINASMVGNYVDEFLHEGLLVEDHSGTTRRGRAPVPIRPNPDYGCFLGLDFEALRARAVLNDFAGEILHQEEIAFPSGITRQCVLDQITALAEAAAGNAEGKRLLSVGVAAPGQVDGVNGRVINYRLLADFAEVPIQEHFEKYFDVPVFVEQNIRALTFAEMLRGAGRGHDNFLCLSIRSGVGLGIVINRRIYAGTDAMAGEVGYTVFPTSAGPKTMTELISAKGIVHQALRALKSGQATKARQTLLEKGDNLSLAAIVEAAETGDALLHDLLKEVGRNLGRVAANLANLFSPEKIVLAGEVPRCCPLIRDTMHRVFRRHTLAQILKNTYLDWGVLTGFAAALGAAYLGFSKTFPEEERILALERSDQRNAI
jgi:predicted NBD/HSP70 family sugar kinase